MQTTVSVELFVATDRSAALDDGRVAVDDDLAERRRVVRFSRRQPLPIEFRDDDVSVYIRYVYAHSRRVDRARYRRRRLLVTSTRIHITVVSTSVVGERSIRSALFMFNDALFSGTADTTGNASTIAVGGQYDLPDEDPKFPSIAGIGSSFPNILEALGVDDVGGSGSGGSGCVFGSDVRSTSPQHLPPLNADQPADQTPVGIGDRRPTSGGGSTVDGYKSNGSGDGGGGGGGGADAATPADASSQRPRTPVDTASTSSSSCHHQPTAGPSTPSYAGGFGNPYTPSSLPASCGTPASSSSSSSVGQCATTASSTTAETAEQPINETKSSNGVESSDRHGDVETDEPSMTVDVFPDEFACDLALDLADILDQDDGQNPFVGFFSF